VYSALNASTNTKFFAAFAAAYPGATVNLLSGSAGAPTPGAPSLSSVDLVDYDRAWATANRERILGSWRAAVGR
jgi:hypothetical protein